MRINFLAGALGTALILAPLGLAQRQDNAQSPRQSQRDDSDGVRRAIAFQHAKDRADERQARLETRHPSVDYSNADRQMDDSPAGNRLKDPGPAQGQTVKK